MRRSFLTLALLCYSPLALAAAAANDARPVYEPDGSFGFCLMDKVFADGRKLTIAYSPRKQMNVGVTIPNGKFEQGARYDVTIGVDSEPGRKVRASTLDDSTLLLQMGNNPSFRKKLSTAKSVSIGSPSTTVAFETPEMPQMLDRLQKCVDTKSNTRDERATAAEKLMPETLKALLLSAGITDITPLNQEKIPENERPADYLWKTNGIMSGVRERLVPEDKNLDDMIGLHTEGLKKHCPGRYNAQIGRERKFKGLTLRTADVSCTPEDKAKADKAVSVSNVFYLTSKHVFTVFSFESGVAQKKEAQALRDKLATALTSLAKQEEDQAQ